MIQIPFKWTLFIWLCILYNIAYTNIYHAGCMPIYCSLCIIIDLYLHRHRYSTINSDLDNAPRLWCGSTTSLAVPVQRRQMFSFRVKCEASPWQTDRERARRHWVPRRDQGRRESIDVRICSRPRVRAERAARVKVLELRWVNKAWWTWQRDVRSLLYKTSWNTSTRSVRAPTVYTWHVWRKTA